MNNKKFKEKLFEILKREEKLWDDDKTELNQTLLLDIIENFNDKNIEIYESIIEMFLEDEDIKKKFFIKIKDVYVFKTNDFKFFMEENRVYNSFTQYKNRIGLTDGKKFLKDSADVVLNFPYKDCVLEGGQSSEDGLDSYYEYDEKVTKTEEKKGYKSEVYNLKESKRNEIFFNQVLAKDEIDRLFDEKAFVNWKRFNKDGEVPVSEIRRDEEGTIKENLIIKGNNLLALHSLKSQFKGKIKLIYIDPPFNTGQDEFKYNDKFNHSTWLTFIKNRLDIAKELLSDDGIIFVHIGNEEASYLQIILDEIFGNENYLNHITMSTNAPSGFKATSSKIFSTANHIFIYSKKAGQNVMNKIFIQKEYDTNYKYFLLNPEAHFSDWKYCNIIDYLAENEGFSNVKEFKKAYPKEILFKKVSEFANINKDRVFRTAALGGGALKKRKSTVALSKKEKGTIFQHLNEDVEGFYILNGEQIVFWSNTYEMIDGKYTPATSLTDVWTDIGFTGIANEGKVTLKNGKKPEILLKRILELGTKKNDIVLDFFGGSGTTGAVAHKMNRQYILIEQMDYIKDLPENRLYNVINGDSTGISKLVNWQGGGSFIYCELAQFNEKAKRIILDCLSFSDLENQFENIYNNYFLKYNIRIKEFKEKIIKEDNFRNLSLDAQKEMFLTMLDLNNMYVHRTEMEDIKYDISNNDKILTNKFYKKG